MMLVACPPTRLLLDPFLLLPCSDMDTARSLTFSRCFAINP